MSPALIGEFFITEPPGRPILHTAIFKMGNNKNVLYGAGNSAQYYVAGWMGWEAGGEWPHGHAVHLGLTRLQSSCAPISNKKVKKTLLIFLKQDSLLQK